MTINLPKDVEISINAEVTSGHFASADDAVAEIVREYFQRRQQRPVPVSGSSAGLIGALRDDAELLDQAVEHAMKVREERPWRLSPGE
jgi:Arc/MetJ-type ribon-helix-helix transcriptional regulator